MERAAAAHPDDPAATDALLAAHYELASTPQGRLDALAHAAAGDPGPSGLPANTWERIVSQGEAVAERNRALARATEEAQRAERQKKLTARQEVRQLLQRMTEYPDSVSNREVRFHRSALRRFAASSGKMQWPVWQRVFESGSHPSQIIRAFQKAGVLDAYPELAVLADTEQDAHWHPEGDVLTHCSMASDRAAVIAEREGVTGQDRAVIVAAAMLHDAGKATHTQHDTDENGAVRITSHGHAEAGVDPALRFLRRVGCPEEIQRRVAPLVAEHMCGASTSGAPTPRAARNLAVRLAPATVREWALVVEADRTGRGSGLDDPAAAYDGFAQAWVQRHEAAKTTAEPQPKPLVTGQAFVNAGVKPGPHFRDLLDRAAAAQRSGEITDEASAAAWVARTVSG